MAQYPQFIDNKRKTLAETLRTIAPSYNVLRIATGYWDLAGTLELIDEIKHYTKIHLLIGQEPLANHLQKKFKISVDENDIFPDSYVQSDLEDYGIANQINELRETSRKVVTLIKEGNLEVKVFRKPRLHAKAYIFGELGDGKSVGIVGSSNFTKAGLTTSQELNFLTYDYKIVEFEPKTENQENGHITWFEELWNDIGAEDWTGDFTEILSNSPVGDKTYGPYDVYIKTLMEVFPDELIDISPFDTDIEKVLHEFQNQNALSLRRKLDTMGVAMLSDSVGLGKTITAAAIIKQYIHDDKVNIAIIPPASLKQQWVDELESDRWNLVEHRDFEIYTQQDSNKIERLIDKSKSRRNKRDEIDLFVVDEAHNLRNAGSTRHQQILELFQENPDAKVLLLTATPINNSLMDFANQIQLGSKGDLVSVNVPYATGNSQLEYIDFFEALKRIQSQVSRAEKNGEKLDWNIYRKSLTSGIRHYLVRSTRQGVIKRNAMKSNAAGQKLFPDTKVEQFSYSYGNDNSKLVKAAIEAEISSIFEGFDPRRLNLDFVNEITQRTIHPIDLYTNIHRLQEDNQNEQVLEDNDISEKYLDLKIINSGVSETVIPLLFQLINFLGFPPYKPDSYHNEIYGKSIPDIRSINIPSKIRTQLAIHNMLHVTWLKRLESSMMALKKSISNYKHRIEFFENWLDKGFIVNLSDASLLENEYGEDIDKAFEDYEQYLTEIEEAIDGDEEYIKKRGIERKEADENIYNLVQLRKDINRDKLIIDLLLKLLGFITQEGSDEKLNAFITRLCEQINEGKHGNKVLIFSFFSDTIEYLRDTLPKLLEDKIPGFSKRSEFVSGNSKEVDNIAKRFSPKSKKYQLKTGEIELNFLFATDVLSEGQNLQDAGILVNYDLHWNPVRMIQRNGRINRLGSCFDEVLIANATPSDDLETYLKLVRRIERKIDTINSTVGNDQSVLGEEANPIEFNDMLDYYNENEATASKAAYKLENQGDPLDWIDNYSLELRDFLEEHKNDGEIERIQAIPKGKWNYLPHSKETIIDPSEVIGLYTTSGKITGTGEKIKDIGFVKIAFSGQSRGPFRAIRTEYMEEQEALHRIKTTPDDDTINMDTIKVNREEYISKGKVELKVQFDSNKAVFDLKPSHIKALEIVGTYFTMDVLGVVKKGIKRSNEKREFEQLVRKLNREVKESGAPYSTTIRRFEVFINKLLDKENQEQKIDKIQGVLFYANNEKA
ncbi:helicase domain/SNF2 family domain protein [Carnobacterium sp. AT7]|uniref:helicase-related protein n=1 Tax=Carnobacterium sp. AT7 TaxID=333990 RepID=UPI00015F1D07|nr:SNF2-related protein [Carnobacterium sp. AT7]EDP69028.1 helicase domain/SNF2 family domain protein [Carnobacterium sp. AT7]